MDKLDDVWAEHDFPVLRAVVRLKDEKPTYPVRATQVQQETGLSEDQVQQAAANLERGGLVTISGAMGLVVHNFTDVSERALRLTGLWPDEEARADQLLWILEQRIEAAGSPEERGKWVRIRDAVGAAGRDFVVELAAALATRGLG